MLENNPDFTPQARREYNRWLDECFFNEDPQNDPELAQYCVAAEWYNYIPNSELDIAAAHGFYLLGEKWPSRYDDDDDSQY